MCPSVVCSCVCACVCVREREGEREGDYDVGFFGDGGRDHEQRNPGYPIEAWKRQGNEVSFRASRQDAALPTP